MEGANKGRKRASDSLRRLGDAVGEVRTGPYVRRIGRVVDVAISSVGVAGLEHSVTIGSHVEVETASGSHLGEVIGVGAARCTVRLYDSSAECGLNARVACREKLVIHPAVTWKGRVIDSLGRPIDGLGPIVQGSVAYPLDRPPLEPMTLGRVRQPCITGVRAIDLFTPVCFGQRIGVFAGSGVGKSTLLSMISRCDGFKTIVVALVAERGREVREFVEDVLEHRRSAAVTVVATSAESAMMRKLAAQTAMSVAEHFRDQGEHVLLVVDSVTRFAHALREVALSAGEPPVARGYPPSVFSALPRLLERAGPGPFASGSITGVFSVLVDGDDLNEPVSDTVRGILDGHVVLNRSIAEQGRYPAIDPLASLSRLASHVFSADEATLIRKIRAIISRYEDTKDLRALGGYKHGQDPELDQAVLITPIIYKLLTQLPNDPPAKSVFQDLYRELGGLKSDGPQSRGKDGDRPLAAA